MNKLIVFILFSIFTVTCIAQSVEFKVGTWRGVIDCQGHDLPFTFEVTNTNEKFIVYIKNGAEKIALDEVTVFGDSVKMILYLYDAELRAKINDKQLTGTFIKNYARHANQTFSATFGDNYRFAPNSSEKTTDYSGKYQVEFITSNKKITQSVGLIQQDGNHLTGSFLTPTGDYRYLEGNVMDGKLMLSAFDGNHAFVFIASKSGESLKGDFYSGKTSHETFKGVKNENAKIPNPEALTYLKSGFKKIDFKFPDLDYKMVSSSDPRFKNKVLILQLFGTWCPNCIDETKFLVPWYNKNHDRGVEILGLAYERKDDFTYAGERIIKMVKKLNVPYDFVIAGTSDKAAQSLPMLSNFMGFPTTIFIGKDGKVKYIHTGFEGPATGVYYERFQERFNQIVNELLAQK